MVLLTLKVEGMSCGHCKAAVEKALKETDGVQDARVDLASKMVTISYNSSMVNRESLVKVITDVGYDVVG